MGSRRSRTFRAGAAQFVMAEVQLEPIKFESPDGHTVFQAISGNFTESFRRSPIDGRRRVRLERKRRSAPWPPRRLTGGL